MKWWRKISREEDLERELRADLELEAEEQEANGRSSREAREAARRAFGNVTWMKEEVRFMWGSTLWETIFQELRYAMRTLRKSPAFAATAILTLALGIGAGTAVFTVVDSVLLKPLAYHDSGRLVACWERVRFLLDDATGPNPRHVELWRQRASAFSGLAYVRHMAMGLTLGHEHPNQIGAVTTIPNLFDILQVHALIGRTFVPDDGVQGHDNVAVLTYPLWKELFHGDPGVIGTTIRLGDVSRQVVGVLPADFHFPGVESAAMVSAMPLDGESWVEAVQRVDQPNLETPLINLRWVSPGYFETIHQPLLTGRFFEERDRNLSSVVLSEGEAKVLWESGDSIGGQIKIEGRPFTVIGVVADSRTTSLKTQPTRMAYVHYKDRPPYPTYFLIRAANVSAAVPAMRQAIWKYDPGVTIARVKTLDTQLTDSLATERFETMVLLSFGAAALLLAMLGIYGVLSYSVATRNQEIGVRMALGATRGRIYALTFAEGGAPVIAGVIAGLAASIVAGRAIQKLLFGIQAPDPPVILTVTGLFLLSAVAAAFVPARRAASVDPMQALRSE